MATEIEAARQLMYHIGSLIDAGEAAITETSMVTYVASEMAERVTSEAMQILGNAGYTTLHPAERYWRDARSPEFLRGHRRSGNASLRISSWAKRQREGGGAGV